MESPDIISDIRYAGFWRRVGAHALDLLILSPWVAVNFWVGLTVDRGPFYLFLPALAIALWYNVYLVSKNGGTPGQRVLDLRVKRDDLSRIDLTNAIWRYFLFFANWLTSAIGQAIAGSRLAVANGSMYERIKGLSEQTPNWVHIISAILGLIAAIDILWIFTNKQRRQLVDYLAQTVVVIDEPRVSPESQS